jgi:hypothetical protein
MSFRRQIGRREFLKSASAATLGTTLLLPKQEKTASPPPGRSRVVLIRDPNVLDESGRPRAAVVQDMLDAGVKALTGKADPQSAWKTLIRPDDIVGIKNNRWPYLRTTPEVENALKTRIMEAGVSEARLSVDDLGVLQNPVFQKATALINARPMRSHRWAGVGSLIKGYIMFIPTIRAPSTPTPVPTWPRSGTCRWSRGRPA